MKKTAPVAKVKSQPAPVKGLNFRDALAAMRPTDALRLDNVVCRPSYLEARKGWAAHVTGITGTVETLMVYSKTDGTDQLIACAGTAMYNVTSAGAVGAAVVSGLTNAMWAYTQVSNTAGNFLLCVNGVDSGRSYDGTTWSAWSITGVASTALTQLLVWKRRVLAIEESTFKMWYLAADAISGAMTSFSFSGIFQRGGYLTALINWTVDGGSGVDDHLLVVTSEGEVALYKGTDPSTAANFALQGVYFIGKPVGTRFYTKKGGDVIFLTSSGVVSFTGFLQDAAQVEKAALSDRILPTLQSDILAYGATSGWEIHHYVEETLLIVQVPAGSVGSRYQWVQNTQTGAWSRLYMADAATFAILNRVLYAGHSTQVVNSWTGGTDGEEDIEYTIVPAFSYFGTPSSNKKFSLGRVVFEADARPAFQVKLLSNFDQSFNFASLVAGATNESLWGTALWGEATWLGSVQYYRPWSNLNGQASSGTMAIQGVHQGSVLRLVEFTYVYEEGGLLGP